MKDNSLYIVLFFRLWLIPMWGIKCCFHCQRPLSLWIVVYCRFPSVSPTLSSHFYSILYWFSSNSLTQTLLRRVIYWIWLFVAFGYTEYWMLSADKCLLVDHALQCLLPTVLVNQNHLQLKVKAQCIVMYCISTDHRLGFSRRIAL